MKVKVTEERKPVSQLEFGVIYESEDCVFLMIDEVKNNVQTLNAIIFKSSTGRGVPRLTKWSLSDKIFKYEGELTISND